MLARVKRLHAEGLEFIQQYRLPGNVRELENIIHREFLMSNDADLRLRESRDERANNGSEPRRTRWWPSSSVTTSAGWCAGTGWAVSMAKSLMASVFLLRASVGISDRQRGILESSFVVVLER